MPPLVTAIVIVVAAVVLILERVGWLPQRRSASDLEAELRASERRNTHLEADVLELQATRDLKPMLELLKEVQRQQVEWSTAISAELARTARAMDKVVQRLEELNRDTQPQPRVRAARSAR